MTRREELLSKIESVDKEIKSKVDEYNEMLREYEELDEDDTCNCENCSCSDECDGEFYDDMVTVAKTETDRLGIVVGEDEYGERYVLLQDTVDGERVELNEAELNVIVAMMGL